uniref:Uncharacterized protein n=1 Tax=Eptatretus burgeri TaxID=7764 RepID=A0A8C4N471_EPTBU
MDVKDRTVSFVKMVLEKLLPELASFLEIIDHEPLGTTARRKQQLIQAFIRQIRTAPGEDEEYMYMNSIGLLNETSLVQETRKNNEVCGGIPPGVLPRKPQLPLPEIPELPTVSGDAEPIRTQHNKRNSRKKGKNQQQGGGRMSEMDKQGMQMEDDRGQVTG